jgi:hypothetical protein
VTESGDDASNNFSIPVLTDQHMGTGSAVTERNHELLGVPKRQDDMPPFPIECIDWLLATCLEPHAFPDPLDDRSTYRRKHKEFDPCHE